MTSAGCAAALAMSQIGPLHSMEPTLAELRPRPAARPSVAVFDVSHRLQVGGVDAAAIAAQMVDLQPIRDRSVRKFVGHAMGQQDADTATTLDLAVADHSAGGPFPAFVGQPDLNLRPEPLNKRDHMDIVHNRFDTTRAAL